MEIDDKFKTLYNLQIISWVNALTSMNVNRSSKELKKKKKKLV